MADTDVFGNPLHVKAYHRLRHDIYAHIQSGLLPILGESPVPRGGYEGAIARDGVLKQVILSNSEYVKNVQSSGVPVQLPYVQDFVPG